MWRLPPIGCRAHPYRSWSMPPNLADGRSPIARRFGTPCLMYLICNGRGRMRAILIAAMAAGIGLVSASSAVAAPVSGAAAILGAVDEVAPGEQGGLYCYHRYKIGRG